MIDRVGQQLGNYRLLSLIAQGGFGDIYLAEHVHLGTQAAIKVLHTRLANEDVALFRREARTVARLIHPNIVRVFDFDVQATVPFLVMDYAPNGSLRQRHSKGEPVPLPTVIEYVKQLTDGLQYAHDEKVIHRDVKPENMLLGRRNEVLLSDFGIALAAQSSRSLSTQDVAGTFAYMAPEQLQGKPRQASDQYSLGIVAYEWLSGERPFHGSFVELYSQHSFVNPPSLIERGIPLSSQVEHVVMKALAKDPHQRFESVRAFAIALEQAYTTPIVLASPTENVSTPFTETTPIKVPTPHDPMSEEIERVAEGKAAVADDLTSPSDRSTQLAEASRPSSPLPAVKEQPAVPETPRQALPDQQIVLPPPAPALPQPAQRVVAVANEANIYQPERARPASTQGRSLPMTTIILIVALVVVLAASGLGFLVLRNNGHNQSAQGATATPGHSVTATTQPGTTVTPAVATATATVASQQYSQATSGTPVIDDQLAGGDKEQLRCPTAIKRGYYSYEVDGLHFEASAPTSGNPGDAYCVVPTTQFSNFAYQVQMKIVNGDGGGITFRTDPAFGTGYSFVINKNGSYQLKYVKDNHVLSSGTSPVIQNSANQTYQLTVVAQGSTINLYVNQQHIATVEDSQYGQGSIGMIVSGNVDTSLIFSSAKIWQLS